MSEEIPVYMDGAVCPLPLPHQAQIVMGHGSGGKLSHDLISSIFLPAFDNQALAVGDDAARVTLPDGTRLAFSTDSHVVSPLFFPGGDIGRLAVCGTVNDLSTSGAEPCYLTAGFILEEGLERLVLQDVVDSMRSAAEEAGIIIISGDTKVVQKNKADGLYINTAGVGIIPDGVEISGRNAEPGDVVILSGSIGEHGIAVLEARGELGFASGVQSDVAPLNGLVKAILMVSSNVHTLRDPTRGGLATSLNEIAQQSNVGILIQENALKIQPPVAAACEILGFDPLYIANEGKLIVIASSQDGDAILTAMRAHPYGRESAIIGEVRPAPPGRVLMKTEIGSTRVVDVLSGEILPRIC